MFECGAGSPIVWPKTPWLNCWVAIRASEFVEKISLDFMAVYIVALINKKSAAARMA